MRVLIIISLFLSCALVDVNAQNEQKHYIEFAEEAMALGDYYGASRYYKIALSTTPTDIHLQYAYAEALRLSADYEEAEDWYIRVNRKDRGRYYPEGPFWIAEMMEANGSYEDALTYWNKVYKKEGEETAKGRRAAQRIKSCKWAMSQKDKVDSTLTVDNLGKVINSPESEFGGVLLADSSLVFASLRGPYTEQEVLKDSTTYYIRLYRADSLTTQHPPILLDSTLLRPQAYIANATFSEDERQMYFSICEPDLPCQIYTARRSLDGWTDIEVLPQTINAPASASTQAYYLKQGQTEWLFFSSDRPGGEGGMDLYLSARTDGDWSPAMNLGRAINTEGNEICPFYDERSQRLYFSSDWHEGFGLMDIHYASGTMENGFRNRNNAGRPLNSSVNDLYYRQTSSRTGLLTSNRRGSYSLKGETCCNDLYSFEPKEDKEMETTADNGIEKSIDGGDESASEDLSSADLPETVGSFSELEAYLPIALYFHNDRPDPRSTSRTTALTFGESMEEYRSLRKEYVSYAERKGQGQEMDLFMAEADKQAKRLEQVTQLLATALESGEQVGLKIKGYASPLAKSDYNLFLTERRIQSLVNHFEQWNTGQLSKYISSGALTFEAIPFGESTSDSAVSDAYEDREASVYSTAAAKERRIEILKIEGAR